MKSNLLGALCVIALSGCQSMPWSSSNQPSTTSQSAVTDAVKKWGFSPIYPFAQDLFIGDVRVGENSYAEWKNLVDQGKPTPSGARATSLDNIEKVLSNSEKKRPSFSGYDKSGRIIRFKDQTYVTKPVLLPSFKTEITSAMSGELGASIPIMSASASIFGAKKKSFRYFMTATGVSQIGVSPVDPEFVRAWSKKDGNSLRPQPSREILESIRRRAYQTEACRNVDGTTKLPCTVYATLVYSVVYASTIYITAESDREIKVGAKANASLGVLDLLQKGINQAQSELRSTRSKLTETLVQDLTSGPAAQAQLTKKLPLSDINKVVDSLNRTLDSSVQPLNSLVQDLTAIVGGLIPLNVGSAGGGFSYASSTSNSVTLVGTPPEPVVIGYRGITWKVTMPKNELQPPIVAQAPISFEPSPAAPSTLPQ